MNRVQLLCVSGTGTRLRVLAEFYNRSSLAIVALHYRMCTYMYMHKQTHVLSARHTAIPELYC